MKNFAVIIVGLLLMGAVTDQQQQQTSVKETRDVENEVCKQDLSTIITTTSERRNSLKIKRIEVAELKRVMKIAMDEEEALENEVQNLTAQIQEMEVCSDNLLLDCCQIKIANSSAETGLYKIKDPCARGRAFDDGIMDVRCDMETDGGGWIVIQQRNANCRRINFTRNWEDYETGFGDLDGEFWIGLKNMHELTTQQEVDLQISVWNDYETPITLNYSIFRISGPEDKYRLTVSGSTGDGYDALRYHNGYYFSTYDRDNDGSSSTNCAYNRQGGWWYRNCYHANLNGRHDMSGLPGVASTGQLLRWYDGLRTRVYTNSVMMIRSKTCDFS